MRLRDLHSGMAANDVFCYPREQEAQQKRVHGDYREQFLPLRHHCSRVLPHFSCRGRFPGNHRGSAVRDEKLSAFTEKETSGRISDNARDSGLGADFLAACRELAADRGRTDSTNRGGNR